MLCTQMAIMHNLTADCARRAYSPSALSADRDLALNQANKASRTVATLTEALNKHRGKGQQKVTVEHVHVHQGAQAVIGNVETAPPGPAFPNGRGASSEKIGQSHD